LGKKDGVAGKPRYDGATIDTIAEPDDPLLAHESTLDAQNLILAANVMELARQEYIFARPAGDSSLDLFRNVIRSRMSVYPAKTRQFTVAENVATTGQNRSQYRQNATSHQAY
jgi:hypothetical protein